ncbi:MAG: hypothetical protein ACR2NP_02700, partial [Pirellulaceae bacterium]
VTALLVLLKWRVMSATKFAWLLVGVTAVEVAIAVAWTVALIPVTKDSGPVQGVPSMSALEQSGIVNSEVRGVPDISVGWMWKYYHDDYDFSYPSPAADLAEQYLRDVELSRPKFHLLAGKRQLNTFHSIEPLDALLFRYGLRSRQDLIGGWARRLHRFYFAIGDLENDRINESSYEEVVNSTLRVLQKLDAQSDDWTHVNCDAKLLGGVVTSPLEDDEVVDRMGESLTRLQLRVTARNKRLVVVADYFDDDWQATIETSDGTVVDAPIVRVNRILRGVVVPAGNSQVTMTYRPRNFYRGAWISCLAWLVLILWLVRPRRFR